ncbi:MAG: NAD-dependent epimerase/dehydratase family protein [Ferruginibacter sp.]
MQTIFGAGGAIGIPLAGALKKYTNHIRLVARNPTQVNGDDELYPADLTKAAEVDKAVEGSEIVYLAAGLEYRLTVWKKNWPLVMQNVIDACIKQQAKLVFLDNVYMYAAGAIPHMTEDAAQDPPSKKGVVRKQIADMIFDAVKNRALQAIIARSADFYGPANKASMLNIAVTDNFKKGKKAFWMANADKVHSFTYTPEAARAMALLGNTADVYNQVWHLPTSHERLTGKDFIDLVAKQMGIEPRFYILKTWMIRLIGLFNPVVGELAEMQYQNNQDYFFDSTKFEKQFRWEPVKYTEGIKLMLNS